MTERNIDLVLHHLTRVEGHGNINIKVSNGVVEKCEWSIPEAPRFFEAMALGRQCGEIHHITSRICGICSIGHTIASLRATESAMGITLNDQDLKLRKLALNAETLQSHILHLGFLVLPDLMSVGSVIPLSSSNPDEVKALLRLHRTANEMSNVICGRTTHPQRLVLGGFSKIPSIKELHTLKQNLEEVAKDLESVVDLITGLSKKFPDFVRETEFISLSNPNEYPFYDGELTSSDTGIVPKSEYLSYTNEYIVANSTAKRTKHTRESYMVGALARLNNNYDQLSSKAKKTAEKIDLHPMCHNPFMNNMAQLVEIVHCVEDSIRLINDLESRLQKSTRI